MASQGQDYCKKATVNRERYYLHTVYSELKRLGEWDGTSTRWYPTIWRSIELAFLSQDEIKRLHQHL